MSFKNPTFSSSNVPAEKAVLSAIMRNSDLMYLSEVKEEHFYDGKHRVIFQAISALSKKSESTRITDASLIHAGQSRKKLDDMGGANYLTELYDASFSKDYIEKGIELIKDCCMQRKAQDAANELARESMGKSSMEIQALFTDLDKKMFKNFSLATPKTATTAIADILSKYDDYQTNKRTSGLMLGIPAMDNFLQGVRPCYFVLGALSSVGKTALLCNVFYNMAKQGKKVLFFSQEMTQGEIIERIASTESGVGVGSTSSGVMTKEDLRFVTVALLDIRENLEEHAEIYDDSAMTIADIQAKSQAFKRKHGRIDAIFVDYIQSIDVPGVKVSEEITKVQEVSKRLKGLGKDLGCLMFALSQLTPDAASLEPTPMMLRGSKQIMQDADIIFLMSRKEHRNDRADRKDLILGNFAKGRSIGEAKIEMLFDTKHMRFETPGLDPYDTASPWGEQ